MRIGFIASNDLAGLEDDAKFAAEHGFAGLELNYWADFETLTGETVQQMREILDGRGVRASALGLWGWNHTSPDPAERTRSLQYLSRAIEFAHTLGAEVLITGGGRIPDASGDEQAAELAKVLAPFVRRAGDAGVRIALYGFHGNTFLEGITEYRRVWRHLPQVGIKLDPANVRHQGQDYLPILHEHGERVFHVHVKEHAYIDGELVSQPAAGMGDIQWGKVMALLTEWQYKGYLSIEPHGPVWGRGPMRRRMLRLSQRHIRQFLV